MLSISYNDAEATTNNTVYRWDSAMLKRLRDMTREEARDKYERMLIDESGIRADRRTAHDARFIGAA